MSEEWDDITASTLRIGDVFWAEGDTCYGRVMMVTHESFDDARLTQVTYIKIHNTVDQVGDMTQRRMYGSTPLKVLVVPPEVNDEQTEAARRALKELST